MSAAVMSVAALTETDYLDEARWICKRVPNLWFDVGHVYDPRLRQMLAVYRVYRRGMGKVAERGTAAAMVAYLRKQLPK